MKISLVIALLLSAAITTSTAGAQPREERGGPIPYGQHMRRPPPPPPPQVGDWINLATPTPTHHGTEYINLDRQAGAFRSLRIDAVSGVVFVRAVHVVFANGQGQTFYVARRLDRRHPRAYIEFAIPRRIVQIAITTSRKPAGTYALFGSWGLASRDSVASN